MAMFKAPTIPLQLNNHGVLDSYEEELQDIMIHHPDYRHVWDSLRVDTISRNIPAVLLIFSLPCTIKRSVCGYSSSKKLHIKFSCFFKQCFGLTNAKQYLKFSQPITSQTGIEMTKVNVIRKIHFEKKIPRV